MHAWLNSRCEALGEKENRTLFVSTDYIREVMCKHMNKSDHPQLWAPTFGIKDEDNKCDTFNLI